MLSKALAYFRSCISHTSYKVIALKMPPVKHSVFCTYFKVSKDTH